MKTISDLFDQEALALKLREKIDVLADKLSGRVIVWNEKDQLVAESISAEGLKNLISLNNQIKERLDQEWAEIYDLIVAKREPFCMEGDYGLFVFWTPIQSAGRVLGGLAGYGGFFDDGQGEEGQRQKREDLYHLLGLSKAKVSWDDYIEVAEKIKFIKPDELEQSVGQLAALLGTLLVEEN